MLCQRAVAEERERTEPNAEARINRNATSKPEANHARGIDINLSRFQQGHSLKTRVTFITLIIFVISIWSLALYARKILREEMLDLLGEQQASTATLVATEFNHEVGDRLEALEKVAAGINPAAMGNPVALQTILEGHPVFQVAFNGGTFVTGLDGVAIASVPSSGRRTSVSYLDRDYIAEAIKGGKPAIGRPVTGKKLQAPIIGMAAPVRNAQGKVIGSIAGITNLGEANFLEELMEIRYGKTGGYTLFAPQHRMIVTATNKSRTMESLPAPGIDPLIDHFLGGDFKPALGTNQQGIEVLTSAARIPAAGWLLMVSLPTEEAFAPMHSIQQRLLLATLMLTLFAGGLTWWLVQRLLSPMLAASKSLSVASDQGQDWQPLPIARQDEVGRLIGGFNSLVEELAQRQEGLKQSEERYRTLTEWTPESLVVHDGKKLLYVNPAAINMFGASSAEELLELPLFDLVHPDFREVSRTRVSINLEQGTALPMVEGKFLKLDGTTFFVELRSTSITYDGAAAIQVAMRDITVRKQFEDALRESQENIHLLLNSTGEAIYGIDLDGRCTFSNNSCLRLLGYKDADELLGKNMHWQIHARHADGTHFPIEECRIFEAFKNGQGTHVDDEVLWRSDGTSFPAEYWSYPQLRNGTVVGAVVTFIDITQRKKDEEIVRQLAYYDALTSLANRLLLKDRLIQAMLAGKRNGRYGAVLFMDLDNFKPVNDNYGHGVGDLLLVEAASRLKNCVREIDTVARFGGDEFVVLLDDLSTDRAQAEGQASLLAQKICSLLADPYVLTLSSDATRPQQTIEHRCTASIGITLFLGMENSEDEVLKRADLAMYHAKEAGRNLVRFYEEEDPAVSVAQLNSHPYDMVK